MSYLLGGWQQASYTENELSNTHSHTAYPNRTGKQEQTFQPDEVSSEAIELATVAHDISSPLNVIAGAAWSLKGECSPEDREFWVNCILRNVLSAQNLIEDFRDDIQERIGGFDVCREKIELSHVVREAVEDFAPLVKHLQLRFYREDAWIVGDAQRIKRLVFNLLSIAAKRSATGCEIKIDVWKRGNQVCLFVQDQGSGLSITEIEQMFASINSSHNHIEPTSENLGLASVKRIAEAHGATLKVQGTGNQGAIFEITFKAIDTSGIRGE